MTGSIPANQFKNGLTPAGRAGPAGIRQSRNVNLYPVRTVGPLNKDRMIDNPQKGQVIDGISQSDNQGVRIPTTVTICKDTRGSPLVMRAAHMVEPSAAGERKALCFSHLFQLVPLCPVTIKQKRLVVLPLLRP